MIDTCFRPQSQEHIYITQRGNPTSIRPYEAKRLFSPAYSFPTCPLNASTSLCKASKSAKISPACDSCSAVDSPRLNPSPTGCSSAPVTDLLRPSSALVRLFPRSRCLGGGGGSLPLLFPLPFPLIFRPNPAASVEEDNDEDPGVASARFAGGFLPRTEVFRAGGGGGGTSFATAAGIGVGPEVRTEVGVPVPGVALALLLLLLLEVSPSGGGDATKLRGSADTTAGRISAAFDSVGT